MTREKALAMTRGKDAHHDTGKEYVIPAPPSRHSRTPLTSFPRMLESRNAKGLCEEAWIVSLALAMTGGKEYVILAFPLCHPQPNVVRLGIQECQWLL